MQPESNPLLLWVPVFALVGWYLARRLERKHGRPVWGVPAWAWGLICAFSLVIGAVLLLVAERRMTRTSPAVFVPTASTTAAMAVAYPPAAAVPTPSAAPVPLAPPAGWHPDPSGRHQYRWWDGTAWTRNVSSNGTATTEA